MGGIVRGLAPIFYLIATHQSFKNERGPVAVTFSAYMFNLEANPPGPELSAIVQMLSQKKLLKV